MILRGALLSAALLSAGLGASSPAPPATQPKSNDQNHAVIDQSRNLIFNGDLQAAQQLADQAAADGLTIAAEQVRGSVAEARGSVREAARDYERALDRAIASDSPAMADAAQALSRIYGQLGRTDLVLATANRMLERDPAHRDLYLFERGLAYSNLNEPVLSKAAFDAALQLAEAGGNLGLIAFIHRGRGLWTWKYEHDLTRTLAEFDQALAYGRRGGEWGAVSRTLITYGNVCRSRGVHRLAESLRRYGEGLAVARREHLTTDIGYFLKNMGDVYRQQGDARRSEELLKEAIEIADKRDVDELRWIARTELGMLLQRSDPARSERSLEDALGIIDSEQNELQLADFLPGDLANTLRFLNPYDSLIDLLLAQRRPADAFFVAERQRARAFLATLNDEREELARATPFAFTERERQLLERIKTAQALLRTDAMSDARRADLIDAVARYESQLADLRLKLAVEHPQLAHARFPKLWSVAGLQKSVIAGDESLVAFYLGREQSVAWIITKERVSAIPLPPSKAIDQAVRSALDELRNPFAKDGAAMAALSHSLSIDAVGRLARGTRLVVVPHGSLHDVPFEALVDSNGRPLVERFAISYAPSASSLAFLRSTPRPASTPVTLVAVANPIVGARQAATLRQIDLAHVNLLAPLPETSREVKGIAGPFGRSAVVLEGAQATRSQLRTRGASGARILHFATHGLIDETRPERSGLVLTADPPRDDGLLQARDLYSLRLNADLVTLSACETALGENVTGEGIIGLTRAFFFAGARSVVASLWDVEDASASRLMQKFYANIRNGEAIDISLQHAKLDLLRAGGPTSRPFYWAAFIVSGQARTTIDVPRGSGLMPSIAGIAVALLAALSLAWRKRRDP